jgi:predicted GTPase
MGYDAAQRADLAATVAAADVDLVIAATPVDLARLLPLDKPVQRARYDFAEAGPPRLAALIDAALAEPPPPGVASVQ